MNKTKAVLALTLAGCTSWRVQTDASNSLPSQKPRTVRIALKTGERFILYDAAIKGDSLVGFLSASPKAPNDRRAVARSDITEVAYLVADAVATALAVTLVAVAVVVIAVAGIGESANNGTCQPTSSHGALAT